MTDAIGPAAPPASVRAVRHAWLSEQIEAVHTVSKGAYAPVECTPNSPSGWQPWSGTTRWRC